MMNAEHHLNLQTAILSLPASAVHLYRKTQRGMSTGLQCCCNMQVSPPWQQWRTACLRGLPRLATLRLARCRLASFPGLARSHDATLRVLDISANLVAHVRRLSAHLCKFPV